MLPHNNSNNSAIQTYPLNTIVTKLSIYTVNYPMIFLTHMLPKHQKYLAGNDAFVRFKKQCLREKNILFEN